MPELANPWASPGTSLNEQRSSKSLGVPFVQIRNVFPLAGFSAVVWPVMAPSLTDHSFGLPSQPVRSLPLKILAKPGSAGRSSSKVNSPRSVGSDNSPCAALESIAGWANKAVPRARAVNGFLFIVLISLSFAGGAGGGAAPPPFPPQG